MHLPSIRSFPGLSFHARPSALPSLALSWLASLLSPRSFAPYPSLFSLYALLVLLALALVGSSSLLAFAAFPPSLTPFRISLLGALFNTIKTKAIDINKA